MHSVIRIDEVEKAGPARSMERQSGERRVSAFPTPVLDRPGEDSGAK